MTLRELIQKFKSNLLDAKVSNILAGSAFLILVATSLIFLANILFQMYHTNSILAIIVAVFSVAVILITSAAMMEGKL